MIAAMIRLILHWMVLCCALLAAALGAMHAQPYDDGGFWASLNAPECAPHGSSAPCFLGIRPGVTSGSQALDLLRALPWVATIRASAAQIEWTWNGQQPAFLRSVHNDASIRLEDGIVHWIGVETAVRLADLKIVLGAPEKTYYRSQILRDSTKNYYAAFAEYAIYPAHTLEGIVTTVCPASAAQVWALPVTLSLPAVDVPFYPDVFAPLPGNCQ